MGASSVTGVGVGSAEGQSKGPGNNRNMYVSLLTPHVEASGIVTCASSAATVTFSKPLNSSNVNYVVLLTVVASSTTSHGAVLVSKADVSGHFASFNIASTNATEVVQWSVIGIQH